MKTESNSIKSNVRSFTDFCASACRNLLEQVNRTKTSVVSEFQRKFGIEEHLLHLAMNEAEALAWQTGYPQLVFADLAAEKAQEVVRWNRRQRAFDQL